MLLLVLAFLLSAGDALALPAKCKDECQIFFSPKDQLAQQMIELIDQEKESLYIATYDLSHQGVIQALQRARKRGVKVEVVIDEQGLSHGNLTGELLPHSIGLFLWKQPKQSRKDKKLLPIMHNKFCVFGKRAVWTGSYNFSYKGDVANRENAVLLTGDAVADRYKSEFLELKSAAKRLTQE